MPNRRVADIKGSLSGTTENESKAPLIPSERVDEIARLVKDTTATKAYRLSINESVTPGLTSTKFGGLPYWPKGKPYPSTSKGQKLMLLAQLRLEDFAACEKFPSHGLLQFFIDSDDDCSGMDFDDGCNQDGFRVVWHESIDQSVTSDDVKALDVPNSFDSWDEALGNPLRGEFALDIRLETSWINPACDAFDEVFLRCSRQLLGDEAVDGRDDWYSCLAKSDSDRIFDLFEVKGPLHQVLGYPFFTQYDPRYVDGLKDMDTLMLQIDTDGVKNRDRVLWGDVGIGGFFINGESLRRGDFSRVLFNWDCY